VAVHDGEPGGAPWDYERKMAIRRRSREGHMLGTALEKIIDIAREDGRLSGDIAERYTMSCTLSL